MTFYGTTIKISYNRTCLAERRMSRMKNDLVKTIMAKVAYDISVKEANSSCGFFFYQPKLPAKVKKLRKF